MKRSIRKQFDALVEGLRLVNPTMTYEQLRSQPPKYFREIGEQIAILMTIGANVKDWADRDNEGAGGGDDAPIDAESVEPDKKE